MAKKPTTIDHRRFKDVPYGTRDSKKTDADEETAVQDGYWWAEPEETLHDSIFGIIKQLNTQQGHRISNNLRNLRRYGDKELLGQDLPTGARWNGKGIANNAIGRERITFNVTRMGVDTLAAKVAKNKPKVSFVTSGGDWKQRQRAKGLEKYVAGVFYETALHKKARRMFKDGCIQDGGVLKWFREGNKIRCERVFPNELYVDEADGIYGEPRSIYQVKAVPREVLRASLKAEIKKRPDLLENIRTADAPHMPLTQAPKRGNHSLSDFVEVVEAWHLPSAKGAGDGKHVIAISNANLLVEDWTRDRFPFVVFRYSEVQEGFWGQGVAEQLVGIQTSINKKCKAINAMLHLCSVPRYYVEETSNIVTSHLNNDIGAIVKYRGQAPQMMAANAVPPEWFSELEREKARAFELIGLSQLSVAAQKPAGLNSAVAQREYQDIESERFSLTVIGYEEAFLECAEQVIDLSEEIAADGEEPEVAYATKGSLERVKWADVDLDRDAFVMQMFPTSSLPQTPAGRKQSIAEMQQAGWIDALEARRLLDLPDIESSNNVAFAAREDVENACQDILDGKPYEPPEPDSDLEYGVVYFRSQYLRAKRGNAPHGVRRALLAWIDQAKDLLDQAKAAAQPPPGPPPGPPGQGGPPGAPPVPQAA